MGVLLQQTPKTGYVPFAGFPQMQQAHIGSNADRIMLLACKRALAEKQCSTAVVLCGGGAGAGGGGI